MAQDDGNDKRKDDNGPPSSPPHLSSALWHGLGLFGESYLLFSVGTLRPLWEALYPGCFDESDFSTCRRPYLTYRSVTYSVVLGVMAGMAVLGVLAGTLGRRRGSIVTASLMAGGATCLSLCSLLLASRPSALFPAMGLSLLVFGVGVGGEYPLSASSASERAMAAAARRRGQEGRGTQGDHDPRKMMRLLSSPHLSASSCRTPQHGNLSKKDDSDPVAAASPVTAGAAASPLTVPTDGPWWQTLNAKAGDVADGDLTPVAEESYGNVALSRTGSPEETENSLATRNVSLRTRGREVLLVFSMQGMGILANSLVLTFLLMIARRGGVDDDDNVTGDGGGDIVYDRDARYMRRDLLNVWRITYAAGAAVLVYVLVSRIYQLEESEVWTQDRRRREEDAKERQRREEQAGFRPPRLGPYERRIRNEAEKDMAREKQNVAEQQRAQEPVLSPTLSSLTMMSEFDLLGSTNLDGCRLVPAVLSGGDGDVEEDVSESSRRNSLSRETMLLFRHYGVRLFGTSLAWLLWDVAYYGNKLFQSSFLIALTGEEASLVVITGASAINALVALLGYYAAAAIVDDPDCGRLSLQQMGFVITGTLFLLCGLLKDRLPPAWLAVMYLGSSFFSQCGPNCTTFLVPAEVFPTSARAACHGASACAGKAGALLASVLFHIVDERGLFLVSGYASFAGALVTFLTIPETTTLDLYEIDRQWHMVLSDESYEGPASDPRHLSFYERNQHRLCCTR